MADFSATLVDNIHWSASMSDLQHDSGILYGKLELEIFILMMFDASLLLYLLNAQSFGPEAPQHSN